MDSFSRCLNSLSHSLSKIKTLDQTLCLKLYKSVLEFLKFNNVLCISISLACWESYCLDKQERKCGGRGSKLGSAYFGNNWRDSEEPHSWVLIHLQRSEEQRQYFATFCGDYYLYCWDLFWYKLGIFVWIIKAKLKLIKLLFENFYYTLQCIL